MKGKVRWNIKGLSYIKRILGICLILLFGICSSLILSSTVLADDYDEGLNVIELEYQIGVPIIERSIPKFYHSISIPGLTNRQIPGEPVIPFKTAEILIPYGHEIQKIEVVPGESEYLGKIRIAPGQEPFPISLMEKFAERPAPTAPNELIYASLGPYPSDVYSVIGVQDKCGYKILYLNLYPISYIPNTNDTYYIPSFDVTVTTTSVEDPEVGLLRDLPQDREIVMGRVDNPDIAVTYVPIPKLTESSPLLTGTYDYVIITNQALKSIAAPNNFQALASWKESRGISATIVTVEEIYAAYSGDDNQEKIRNFITDAYNNNDITYVLLGGDADGANVGGESGDNIVPVRGLWAWAYECNPPNIPADLYYACLGGNYDYDNDGIYGEPNDGPGGGEVDLVAEVYVGRAPVDSGDEVRNFVRKTIAYEATSSGDPYLKDVWMVGEHLGFGGVAEYAGNCKDEIKDGSTDHGYTTIGFPDGEYDVSTLYDRDYPGNNWPRSVLINIINGNIHTINHLGHASPGYVMKMYNSNVDALTNTKHFLGYSQGCYPGSFDNRYFDPSAGGSCQYLSYDCILEHFVTGYYGAFAFIGNSRYGWGRWYSTDGASQRYDRQFWDAIFGENIRNIGRANQDSKEDNIGSISEGVMRFCYYEINLLGDPETPYFVPALQEHDIGVTNMQLPDYTRPGVSVEVSTSIRNLGANDESNIVVQLLEDGAVKDSQTITSLSSGGSTEASFTWSNSIEGEYTLRIYAVPVSGENYTGNNYEDDSIRVTSARIILVDDDVGASYEIYYEDALNYSNYNYIKTEGSPTLSYLNDFNCTIWFTGNDYSNTLTSTDRANLAAFLDCGGTLFITGQDIGWDIGDPDYADTSFYNNYLHASYVRDDTNLYTLIGVADDPISDGMTIGISGGDGASNQAWPSEISPLSGSSRVFNYQGDGCGAIKVDTGTYKVVYFAFGFEAISSSAVRNETMNKVLEYISPRISVVVNNSDATNITSYSATLNGAVTEIGTEEPAVYIYWGDNDGGTAKTAWDNEESVGTMGLGTFYKNVTGLDFATTYYYRCYANCSGGEVWADSSETFDTLCIAPTVNNSVGASDITCFSAKLNGAINDSGGEDPTIYFYWGDNDGGTNPANWDYIVNVGGLGIGMIKNLFCTDACEKDVST